jgi:hypothetical protein
VWIRQREEVVVIVAAVAVVVVLVVVMVQVVFVPVAKRITLPKDDKSHAAAGTSSRTTHAHRDA